MHLFRQCLTAGIALLLLSSCQLGKQPIDLKIIPFPALPHWTGQHYQHALDAFLQSCSKPIKTGVLHPNVDLDGYAYACKKARSVPKQAYAARRFFEQYFTPYRASHPEAKGFVTGYYEPVLQGSLTPDEQYKWPLYAPPKGTMPSREAIQNGALDGKGLEIVWLNDPVMRFFLHVQGSGKVQLKDGSMRSVRYAAKNGLPYHSIGKELLKRGELKKGNVSLQTLRDWLYKHPEQRDALFATNPSYVFFSLTDDASPPIGAQGVPLTPEHSLAIDPAYLPYGLPVYVHTSLNKPDTRSQALARLLVTQDTGSAIRGPLRADIFFGRGKSAEQRAGYLQSQALFFILLPNPPAEDA